jgi:hypothetical protein
MDELRRLKYTNQRRQQPLQSEGQDTRDRLIWRQVSSIAYQSPMCQRKTFSQETLVVTLMP